MVKSMKSGGPRSSAGASAGAAAANPETPASELDALAAKSGDEAVLRALAENSALSAAGFRQLVLRSPHIAVECGRLRSMSAIQMVDLGEDEVAALLCQEDAPPSIVERAQERGIWTLARGVGQPDDGARQRAWGPWSETLLERLAELASGFVRPPPPEAVDLLGVTFHEHYRHASAHRLAWIDISQLSRARVRKLGRHRNADGWVWLAIVDRLTQLFHEGDDAVTEEELALAKSRSLGPRGDLAAPPPRLQSLIDTLLTGEADDVRTATEKISRDPLLDRIFFVPQLPLPDRKRVLLRLLRFGFPWQRDRALACFLAIPTLGPSDFEAAAARVGADQVSSLLADERLTSEALATLWPRFVDLQHELVKHPQWPSALLGERRDYVLDYAAEHTVDRDWLTRFVAATDAPQLPLHALLKNPLCPPEVRRFAARHPLEAVRSLAAMCEELEEPEQLLLARDSEEGIRQALVSSLGVGSAALSVLARDASATVRQGAAWNRGSDLETVMTLCTDPAPKVRRMAIDVAEIAQLALWQSANPELDLERAPTSTRRAAATRFHIAPAAVAALSRDPRVEVRVCLVKNPAIAGERLDLLADDAASAVRRAVALSPRASVATLEKLAKDPRRCVSILAARRRHGA